MSLTLPAVYSSASKQGNIQENWIVQLGFYNGDAEGSGEGGWDAALQTGGAANLINHLGSELVTSGGNLAPNGNWTIRDADGGTGGWSGANPPVFQDTETSSMVNGLTGDFIDAGENYSLTFTVGTATLAVAIGGGDLSGNTADETYIATTTYSAGTHTVTFQATGDATHLWLTAITIGSGNGTLDDVILKASGYGSSETAIVVDDGTVFVAGDFIKIENEIMKLSAAPDGNELTVVRGAMSTTAAAHNNDTAIYWNNFTPIALSDTTVDSVFYRGVITNTPSIRTSIDLARSTAKTGNISLSLANFQYQGDDFSAELFLGTRKYINREVRIYSQLNDGAWEGGSSTLSNCLQIYSGRLIDISHDDSKITLQLTEQRPWDFITTPTNISTYGRKYFPVAYGDFEANTSSDGSESYCNAKRFFPIPVDKIGGTLRSLSLYDQTTSASGASSPNPHIFNTGLQKFIPLYESSSDTEDTDTESYDGGNALISHNTLKRSVKFKGISLEDDDGGKWAATAYSFDKPDRDDTIDTDAASTFEQHAGLAWTGTGGGTTKNTTSTLKLELPQIPGKWTKISVQVRGKLDNTLSTTAGVCTIKTEVINVTAGASQSMKSLTLTTPDEGSPSTTGFLNFTTDDFTTQFLNNSSGLTTVDIQAKTTLTRTNANGRCTSTGEYRIIDIRLFGTIELDFDETDNKNYQDASDQLSQVEMLYSGGDGYSQGYDGGSGNAKDVHEAHRDILNRFCGFDKVAGIGDNKIEGWTDNYNASDADGINGHRKGWRILWWANEPIEVEKVLQKLQYEGGFIFNFRPGGGGRYTHIIDSYVAADVAVTLTKNDIDNLKINTTPFSELLTNMGVNYNRHPVEKKYIYSATHTNSTARTNWNIQTKENVKEINLDCLASAYSGTDLAEDVAVGETAINVDDGDVFAEGDIIRIEDEKMRISSVSSDTITVSKGYASTSDTIHYNNDRIYFDKTVSGSNSNESFANYYDNIFSDVKKIISCDIVNPAVSYNLETGDIVQFSNTAGEMPVDPLGDNWADYYMITTLNRSLGKVSITVREVG
ncbi:hypothetical protein [uncultured Mediterranean phage uvDeep-CGR2-KM18-C269]|nr:hypothetical protein [uncultured Mediterranean phage uvDeep-CGR2-KM18-C269]